MKKATIALIISVIILIVGLLLPSFNLFGSGAIIGGAEPSAMDIILSIIAANRLKILVCFIGITGTIINGIFVIKNRRK